MTSYSTPTHSTTRDVSGASTKGREVNSPISEHKSIQSISLSPSCSTERKRNQHRWEEETAVFELDLSLLSTSSSLYIPRLETITEDPRKRQHRWDEDSVMDFSVLSISTSDLYNPELDPIAEDPKTMSKNN